MPVFGSVSVPAPVTWAPPAVQLDQIHDTINQLHARQIVAYPEHVQFLHSIAENIASSATSIHATNPYNNGTLEEFIMNVLRCYLRQEMDTT